MAGSKPEKYGKLRERSILFTCDNWGIIVDEKPERKWRDMALKPFLILPSRHLLKAYPELRRPGVKWVSTDLGECIWREYPIEWVDDKNRSRSNSIVRISCNFDGDDSDETRRIKWYTDQIKDLRQDNDSLLLRVQKLRLDLKLLTKERIAEALETAELDKVRRKVYDSKDKDDTDDSNEDD